MVVKAYIFIGLCVVVVIILIIKIICCCFVKEKERNVNNQNTTNTYTRFRNPTIIIRPYPNELIINGRLNQPQQSQYVLENSSPPSNKASQLMNEKQKF